MVSYTSATVLSTAAGLFASQALGAAVPAAAPQTKYLTLRDAGIPASNPSGMTCFNKWEDTTTPYWYVTIPNVGNDVKADRVWNHLNLNGCAPTENKYYVESSIKGCALTFHTSSACTADRVSRAIRSGSDPGVNVACEFHGPGDDPFTGQDGAEIGIGVLEGIFESLGGGH